MNNPNQNADVVRCELEKVWKSRWQEAKLNFELASLHMAEIKEQTHSGAIIPLNAFRDALEAKSAALTEYTKVLRAYTDLVVHGKMPEEPKIKTDEA